MCLEFFGCFPGVFFRIEIEADEAVVVADMLCIALGEYAADGGSRQGFFGGVAFGFVFYAAHVNYLFAELLRVEKSAQFGFYRLGASRITEDADGYVK